LKERVDPWGEPVQASIKPQEPVQPPFLTLLSLSKTKPRERESANDSLFSDETFLLRRGGPRWRRRVGVSTFSDLRTKYIFLKLFLSSSLFWKRFLESKFRSE
jgi:hypothetical protein